MPDRRLFLFEQKSIYMGGFCFFCLVDELMMCVVPAAFMILFSTLLVPIAQYNTTQTILGNVWHMDMLIRQ